jgi:hypothetical protein
MYTNPSARHLALYGIPCGSCGHPAEYLVIYPAERVVMHVGLDDPPCHLGSPQPALPRAIAVSALDSRERQIRHAA